MAIDLDRAKELAAVPLAHPKVTITLGMLSRKAVPLTASAQAFVSVFKKHMQRRAR